MKKWVLAGLSVLLGVGIGLGFALFTAATYSWIDVYVASYSDVSDSHGAVSREKKKLILDWLNSHRRGWEVSFVTYSPRQQYFGGGFCINVMDDLLILNYRGILGENRFIQIVKDLSPDEVAFWRKLEEP